MSTYPKTKYHSETRETQIINNQEQEDALGDEWFDTPRAAGWLGEEAKKEAKKTSSLKAQGKLAVDQSFIEGLQDTIQELSTSNAGVEAKLQEAEDYIDTLNARVQELEGLLNQSDIEPPNAPDAPETSDAPDPAEVSGPEVSEAAVKLADEYGVDLSGVIGTGANGNITKPDIQAIIDAAASAAPETSEGGETPVEGNQEPTTNPED